jgi:hypothetical protein
VNKPAALDLALIRTMAAEGGNRANDIRFNLMIGQILEPIAWGGQSLDDQTAWERVVRAYEAGTIPIPDELMAAYLTTKDGACNARFAARWVQQQLPMVEVAHKLGAALICSTPGEETREMFRCPWRAVMIHVPPGLIQCVGRTGELEDLFSIHLLAWTFEGQTTYGYTTSSRTASLFQTGLTVNDMYRAEHDFALDLPGDPAGSISPLPMVDCDRRAMTLCRKLIRGLLLYIADPTVLSAARRSPGTSSKAKKASIAQYGYPIVFDRYFLGRDIACDLRPVVSAYNRGERSSPQVRHLVRGHHKVVRHGKGGLLTKIAWIEPYFRGADELPPLIKTHTAGAP